VLSLLLRARDEEGRGMSDVELRDELITLLEAGHETTATGLAWAFERLLRHPAALARLTDEVEAGESEYLDAVVRETLRSRPVVLDTPRLLSGPLEIGGYTVPGGWYVAPAITSVQLDPSATPKPEEFRPERFLEDPPRDGWIPFGGGKRHCVGSHLALLEMKVVIAEVVRRWRLEAASPQPEGQRVHHVTLIPSEGARAIVRRAPREAIPTERAPAASAQG
jgi:cytochrome P450